jgi:hypothetical protein
MGGLPVEPGAMLTQRLFHLHKKVAAVEMEI